jgi:predicted phage terminase large subunit-like protein
MPDGEISLITPTQLPDKFDLYVQSWDCAFKDLKDSDFVSGQAWGKKGANSFLLDRDKGKYDFPKTLAAIRKMTFKHPLARHKYIEDKANGSAVISTLRHEIPGLIPVNPDGGKVSRANATSFAIQAGNVFLPHPSIAPWVEDFINECTAFPNGKKDDDVDACTQALNKFYKRRHLGLVAKPAGW